MSRYIDANEALRMIRNSKQDCPLVDDKRSIWDVAHNCAISCVEAIPGADVVEVVRCGQCKNWKINPHNLYGGYCRYCEGAKIDHYCSYGERKDECESKKFDVLHAKRIDLKRCPACPNYDAEIIIPMPIYGKYQNTVYVRCKQCGYSTHHHSAVALFSDTESSRYGSWVTDKSLIHAIRSAIEEWNGERKEG